MSNNKRAKKAARIREHFRKFHQPQSRKRILTIVCDPARATKSIEDMTDYEVQQIWAEAVHYWKQEGMPLPDDNYLTRLVENDPFIKGIQERMAKLAERAHLVTSYPN